MGARNSFGYPTIPRVLGLPLSPGIRRHLLARLILLLLLVLAVLVLPSSSWGQAPSISSLTPTSGPVGIPVTIAGSNFGSAQGNSTVALNGTNATVTTWSGTSIAAIVPVGASSGTFSVTVNGQTAYSQSFTVTALPSGWSDSDVGSVGISGSGTYANGTFTVKGSGAGITGTADAMHFVYQSLSGDGTIVARVVSLSPSGQAGVMIRETLNANATNAYAFYQSSYIHLYNRSSTGGSTTNQGSQSATLPYWVELVRSGNTFSAYTSLNGLYWTQLGSTQTITMAQSVYVGLAVSSNNNSTLATATFDNVSTSSAAAPAPVITSISPTTGAAGTQVTISGSNFGTSQGGSLVTLNAVPVAIDSWSATSVTVTIPSGATSGYLVVSVAPSMNDSNPEIFDVTSQPLPVPWFDGDIGSASVAGSATYANGTFKIQGSGQGISGTADAMHFVYQSLSGDGTIVARVVSLSPSGQAGVMIRETLNANATDAFTFYMASATPYIYFYDRPTTGASTYNQGSQQVTSPYWVKLVRSGSTFSGYSSPDGVTWTQIGSAQTITMAQNVYIGLAVCSQNNSALTTATFDNVSVSSSLLPPVITSLSPTSGAAGSSVTIAGSNFGTVRGNSAVEFNGTTAAITNWSGTSISATVPSPATTGPVVVIVSGQSSNGVTFTAITTGTLSGTITASGSGTAISGAQIQAKQLGGIKATAHSDNNGNYNFTNLSTGIYDIQVSATGYGTSLNSAVSVPAGVTTTLNVSLSLPGTISGTVTRADGVTPIPGATVQAVVGEASGAPVTTDANGNYSITGLNAGSYSVRAIANGYVASSQPETVSANSTTTANFSLQAQGSGTINYVYDSLGRLVGVINPNGDTAVYNYDAVGNLLSISRQSSSQLSIITFTPTSGVAGTAVTLYGTAFSSTATQNTVSFNGTAATVQSATTTQLVVIVPTGVTTGPISVTTSAGTVTSSSSFTVRNQ